MIETVQGQRRLLSPKEVEAEYGIPVPTLAYWRTLEGHGPKFLHIGSRRIKYRRSDIEAWIREQNPDA